MTLPVSSSNLRHSALRPVPVAGGYCLARKEPGCGVSYARSGWLSSRRPGVTAPVHAEMASSHTIVAAGDIACLRPCRHQRQTARLVRAHRSRTGPRAGRSAVRFRFAPGVPSVLRPELGSLQVSDPPGARQSRVQHAGSGRLLHDTSRNSCEVMTAGTRSISGDGTWWRSTRGRARPRPLGRWPGSGEISAETDHACELAYYHHPRWSSGRNHGNTSAMAPFWTALVGHGVDVVLNGHEHQYERFARLERRGLPVSVPEPASSSSVRAGSDATPSVRPSVEARCGAGHSASCAWSSARVTIDGASSTSVDGRWTAERPPVTDERGPWRCVASAPVGSTARLPAMPVEIDIEHVAKLARLDLTDDEKSQLKDQLGMILEHAAAVGSVAADDVPPAASAIPRANVFREDSPEPSIPHEAALANAPDQAGGRFMVPKIAEHRLMSGPELCDLAGWELSAEAARRRDHRHRAHRFQLGAPGAGGRTPRHVPVGDARGRTRTGRGARRLPGVRRSAIGGRRHPHGAERRARDQGHPHHVRVEDPGRLRPPV